MYAINNKTTILLASLALLLASLLSGCSKSKAPSIFSSEASFKAALSRMDTGIKELEAATPIKSLTSYKEDAEGFDGSYQGTNATLKALFINEANFNAYKNTITQAGANFMAIFTIKEPDMPKESLLSPSEIEARSKVVHELLASKDVYSADAYLATQMYEDIYKQALASKSKRVQNLLFLQVENALIDFCTSEKSHSVGTIAKLETLGIANFCPSVLKRIEDRTYLGSAYDVVIKTYCVNKHRCVTLTTSLPLTALATDAQRKKLALDSLEDVEPSMQEALPPANKSDDSKLDASAGKAVDKTAKPADKQAPKTVDKKQVPTAKPADKKQAPKKSDTKVEKPAQK